MGFVVDGQFGILLCLYREWCFSGDDVFLCELWLVVFCMLDYVICEWDCDGDGLLDGEMYNIYDIEFYGLELFVNGVYFVVLWVGVWMVVYLGEYECGEVWFVRVDYVVVVMDGMLWNGEYYWQVIDDLDVY